MLRFLIYLLVNKVMQIKISSAVVAIHRVRGLSEYDNRKIKKYVKKNEFINKLLMIKIMLAFLTFTYLNRFFISKGNNDIYSTEVKQFAECTVLKKNDYMQYRHESLCFSLFFCILSLSFEWRVSP